MNSVVERDFEVLSAKTTATEEELREVQQRNEVFHARVPFKGSYDGPKVYFTASKVPQLACHSSLQVLLFKNASAFILPQAMCMVLYDSWQWIECTSMSCNSLKAMAGPEL